MGRAYKVVDAFSSRPFLGNPVAVVLDAEGLDTDAMQALARWTNLSETTFVLPPTAPGADYRLRIFTPRAELPFAGHPTLGTAHAMLEAGRATPRAGRLVQECGVGLVGLTVEGEGPARRLTLDLPPARVTPLPPAEAAALEALLGHPLDPRATPAIVDVGAVWAVAPLADDAAVLGLEPDLARSAAFERRHGLTGVTVFGPRGAEAGKDGAIEVRSFAPSSGIEEDPVCGSGNGAVAVFRRDAGLLPPGGAYQATQGRRVGRDGQVAVRVDAGGRVSLGGACVTCVDGTLAV